MPVKLLTVSPNPKALPEREIQAAFETGLSQLEPGLRIVASFVVTGVGIIDTLAIDEEGSPVVIE